MHDPIVFARWHLGELQWGDALRSGAIVVEGSRALARALPTWNARRRGRSEATRRVKPEAGFKICTF